MASKRQRRQSRLMTASMSPEISLVAWERGVVCGGLEVRTPPQIKPLSRSKVMLITRRLIPATELLACLDHAIYTGGKANNDSQDGQEKADCIIAKTLTYPESGISEKTSQDRQVHPPLRSLYPSGRTRRLGDFILVCLCHSPLSVC